MNKPKYDILIGDCREQMATLPEKHFHCCVTSPPYFGLRDYGVEGQILDEVEQRHQTHDEAIYPHDLFVATELNLMLRAAKVKQEK